MSVSDINIARVMSAAAITIIGGMTRWEPDARGRLAEAAMELYRERGFEQTTVAEIAERAGLTERTFFRHYADKKEVLFGGAGELEVLMVAAAAGAPASAGPLDAVAAALDAAAVILEERHAFAAERQAVIAASEELRERETMKLASLARALSGALRERGVAEPAASLAADTGMTVFRVGFERWVDGASETGLTDVFAATFADLAEVAASGRA
jgi:AcrR family transcriptional regulator